MSSSIADIGSLTRVHHLNCGDILMPGLSAVTHVLACEYQHGIVMIDVGIGEADTRHPVRRLGVSGRMMYPHLRRERSAALQLADLGFNAVDTAAIVATHLDFDHMGGCADFPLSVPVLVAEDERAAAYARHSLRERMRYREPHLAELSARLRSAQASSLSILPMGLHGVPLDDEETLWLLPLSGHTRGHCAVGVRTNAGWLIHAGDGFFSKASVYADTSVGIRHRIATGMEQLMAVNRSRLAANHHALRSASDAGALVICSHDKQQFRELTGG